MDNVTLIIYIVCLIVVVLFAIVFIAIAALYFNAKKRLYDNKIEDPKVQKDVDVYVVKMEKKQKVGEELYKTAEREKKRDKKWARIWNSVLLVIYLLIVGILGWSAYNKATLNLNWFNNVAPLVIETSSMATVNSANTYIAENGLSGEENRIPQFSFITITNDPNVINSIAQFDVVAFRMADPNNPNTQIIAVHRLIDTSTDANGNTLYTFRGDTNASSYSDETNVPLDRIVGVYRSANFTGVKNPGFGMFVFYIQSPIGITTVVVAFLLMVIYSYLFEGVTTCYDKRFLALLNAKFKELEAKEQASLGLGDHVLTPEEEAKRIAVSPYLGGTDIVDTTAIPAPGFYLADSVDNHVLNLQRSIYDMNEFVYSGRIETGDVQFEIVKVIPVPENKVPNHGYTLEGIADKIFKVENALRCWHDEQGRSFVYVKEDSKLTFVGDPSVQYNIYVRLFENEFGTENNRWIVIYADEKK